MSVWLSVCICMPVYQYVYVVCLSVCLCVCMYIGNTYLFRRKIRLWNTMTNKLIHLFVHINCSLHHCAEVKHKTVNWTLFSQTLYPGCELLMDQYPTRRDSIIIIVFYIVPYSTWIALRLFTVKTQLKHILSSYNNNIFYTLIHWLIYYK